DPHMPQNESKQLSEQEIGTIREWINALPRTNIVTSVGTNQTVWAEAYLKALRAQHKPIWTPPTSLSAHMVIDGFLELDWKQRRIQPSPLCDDRTFARRLYLDLSGRIPTRTELQDFLDDDRPHKRARLSDALLAGDDYSRHVREVFDAVLMGRGDEHREDQRR